MITGGAVVVRVMTVLGEVITVFGAVVGTVAVFEVAVVGGAVDVVVGRTEQPPGAAIRSLMSVTAPFKA